MTRRIAIEDISPLVAGGEHPAKAVVGERVPVRATVWREGHDELGATVVWRGPSGAISTTPMTRIEQDADGWQTELVADRPGMWTFRVDAWSDPWASWRHAVRARVAAGQDLATLDPELETGARLLESAAGEAQRAPWRDLLRDATCRLRRGDLLVAERLRVALSSTVDTVLREHPIRELVTTGPTGRIWVDRARALVGSWYEFFPRSTGGVDACGAPVHGTFRTAAAELPRIAAMGFDVAYLPPVHPIGHSHRKGRNNAEVAGPRDVGSPWAIGSAAGGHDAVHPDLGTLADFDAFVAGAGELGIEVAIDLALQCAPDHPWITEHPEWFSTRPDGSIAYAENPPKRYEDIYPLNFDNDPDGLYAEILRLVLHWVAHGVRIFRVDNPHTKPPDFWHWLIWQVKAVAADVLFLAEAFTRPARLYGLARLGFTQSYTYFIWRTGKRELTEFGTELVDEVDEARPNLFVNTPDILHESLHHADPAMFALRAALAATLSPTWGVYSGYELYDREPVRPGSEEYLDSEKYQLRPRDFAGALAGGNSLEPWLTMLNQIRRDHPALRTLRTLRFHDTDSESLIAYSKTDPVTGDAVLVVVNLDPSQTSEGTVNWVSSAFGVAPGTEFMVRDEVGGELYTWHGHDYVKLDPATAVAHILTVVRS